MTTLPTYAKEYLKKKKSLYDVYTPEVDKCHLFKQAKSDQSFLEL